MKHVEAVTNLIGLLTSAIIFFAVLMLLNLPTRIILASISGILTFLVFNVDLHRSQMMTYADSSIQN